MNRLVIILVVALAVTMFSVPSEGKIEFLVLIQFNECILKFRVFLCVGKPLLPGGVLPYIVYIGMCRCEGYGFQAVYSRIGYINQSVWV